MAGEYLSQLIQLEEALNENSGAFSDAISEQLAQTVNDMKGQQISVEEYLRVMQLFFRKYEREHNRDGQHYCAIRMLQLQHALKKKRRHYALVEGAGSLSSMRRIFMISRSFTARRSRCCSNGGCC
ncbi:MAG: hypothetical protein V8T10_03670 [Merdibacter sp.]